MLADIPANQLVGHTLKKLKAECCKLFDIWDVPIRML